MVGGVSQENVDVSQHALLLLNDTVGPPLLIQDDEGAFCGDAGEPLQSKELKKVTLKQSKHKKTGSFVTERLA